MVHKTPLIILRTVKYGETSLVVTAFTELFGIQTYMVNGVRATNKQGSKAALYQPAAILDAVVYHNEQKNMQRIKDVSWKLLYKNIYNDVVRHSIAVFMMELLTKMLKQPEKNEDLFYFTEDVLKAVDECSAKVVANMPLFFSLQLTDFFGLKMQPMRKEMDNAEQVFLDLQNGVFTTQPPQHLYFLETEDALLVNELLKVQQPDELEQFGMNKHKRRFLLDKLMELYALHIQDFGQMKTLAVMQEVL